MFLSPFLVRELIISKDIHSEATEDVDKDTCDTAQSDDADSLAIHVEAQETGETEVALTCALCGTVYLSVKSHHKRNGIFRNCVRRVRWNTNDLQFALRCREVYIVESRATQCDQFHTTLDESVDYLCVYLIVDEDTHNFLALGKLYGVHRQTVFIIMYIEPEVLVPCIKRFAVVTVRVEKSNFCHMISSLSYKNSEFIFPAFQQYYWSKN